MTASTLETTVVALLVAGKGIFAAGESLPTIGKRFASLDIPSTGKNRRAYREMLLTTPGMCEPISGVILFDEHLPLAIELMETDHLAMHKGSALKKLKSKP